MRFVGKFLHVGLGVGRDGRKGLTLRLTRRRGSLLRVKCGDSDLLFITIKWRSLSVIFQGHFFAIILQHHPNRRRPHLEEDEVTDVLRLSGMTFHATPAEATMMGGCDLQVRREEPLMLLFLTARTENWTGKTMALAQASSTL